MHTYRQEYSQSARKNKNKKLTVVASKWAKVVAGAGSVRSSAGTYTACTEVMDPLFVDVIRSYHTIHQQEKNNKGGGNGWRGERERITTKMTYVPL